jgi:hypothetical protein
MTKRKKDKGTNNDLQNNAQKTEDRANKTSYCLTKKRILANYIFNLFIQRSLTMLPFLIGFNLNFEVPCSHIANLSTHLPLFVSLIQCPVWHV